MAQSNNRTVDGLLDNPREAESGIVHFLMYLPLLACYPLYYIWIRFQDDRELDEIMGESPFLEIPGFDRPDSILLPIASTVLLVTLFVAIGNVTPTLTGNEAAQGVVGVVIGIVGSFYIYQYFERDLLYRVALIALLGLVYGTLIVGINIYSGGFNSSMYRSLLMTIFSLGAATTVGALSANGYIVQTQAYEQFQKKQEGVETDETEDHTQTLSHKGEEISSSKGHDIVEQFVTDTWVAPDELPVEAELKETLFFQPLRDITRKLRVEESRYERTIPDTKYTTERAKHRDDYRNRQEVAPSDFTKRSYSFFVPNSKSTSSCSNCKGKGRVQCDDCQSGQVTCGSCQGAGRTTCGKCRGDGTITVDEKCPACRGSGEKQNGFTCNRCSGYGSVEKRRSCPNCRSGEVECSSCNGSGMLTCGTCSGDGYLECGQCDGCGKITKFEYVEREYKPSTNVSYRAKSVPERVLGDADGTRIDLQTDTDPAGKRLYRKQEETREIDVEVVKYEYLGDLWELFSVEGNVQAVDFPRDYHKQLTLIQVGLLVTVPMYVLLAGLV